jgi:hypothetical protein
MTNGAKVELQGVQTNNYTHFPLSNVPLMFTADLNTEGVLGESVLTVSYSIG